MPPTCSPRCQGFDKLQLLELHLQDSCQVLVDILSRFYFEQSVFAEREQGALFGEAVVITNPSLQKDFRYFIKQKGGMLAKGRLLGIQFKTLFTDNLYFRLAKKTVDQALRIRQAFQKKGIAFHFDSYTNQQFPILTQNQREHFAANYKTTFWQQLEDGRAVVRFCTSWATTDEAVDQLIADIGRM